MRTIKDILESRPEGKLTSVGPEATVFDALGLLASGNYGALPVIDGETLVGIFSERDYARKVVLTGKSSKGSKVSEMMTRNPVCITPEDTLETCMRLMTEKGFRHLPVVTNGRLLNMISMKDAVRMLILDREALLNTVVTLGSQEREEQSRALQRLLASVRAGLEPLRIDADARGGEAAGALQRVTELLDRAERESPAEKKLKSARVLLATDNRGEEVFSRMALAGTGAELDTVSLPEEGHALIKAKSYDIICVNASMIDLAYAAREKNPKIRTVFMTSEDAQIYVSRLRRHPFLSNVVSQSETDRTFTVRSILTTVSKLMNEDYFGMEKYLNWGAVVREHPVERSGERGELCSRMEEYFRGLGIRRTLLDRCRNTAEELLMNAIYDAPVDSEGKHLYNHLERSVAVELKPHERGTFRYGSDGSFLGISVRDPFGSLTRETILDYLEACFGSRESELHKGKGGGGHGLYLIFRAAHLTVFNVQKGRSTEVIALFDLDSKPTSAAQKSSFHFFNA